jgi:hypothetical protein
MMATDSMEPEAAGTPDSPRRRMNPTIEGTATEIASAPIADEPAPDGAPASDPATSQDPDTQAVAESPVSGEPGDAGASPEGPPEGPPEAAEAAAPAVPESQTWRAVVAGVAAAAVVGLVAGATAYWLRPADSSPEILARLSAAESRVADIAGRPAPFATPQQFDVLTARIAELEKQVASAGSGLGAGGDGAAAKAAATRLDTLARQSAADHEALVALDRRVADAQKALADLSRAEPARVADLEKRMVAAASAVSDLRATLESAVKETRAALAAVAEPPALRATRLAVLMQALDAAVLRGTPYQNEIAATRALAPDAAALAPLDAFAATGLPSVDALAGEFAALAPKLADAVAAPAGGNSLLAKFQANAEKLVRVRPSGDAAGDDAGAVIARMEARVRRGDLAGALAESPKLTGDAKALAEPWVKRAQARETARAVAAKLSASALAAVATEGSK